MTEFRLVPAAGAPRTRTVPGTRLREIGGPPVPSTGISWPKPNASRLGGSTACNLPVVDLEVGGDAGRSLADQAAIGVLTQTFPVELVDRVIDQYWRREQRTRALPARLKFYFVLALCLFPDESYRSAMRILMSVFGRGGQGYRVPTTGRAIPRSSRGKSRPNWLGVLSTPVQSGPFHRTIRADLASLIPISTQRARCDLTRRASGAPAAQRRDVLVRGDRGASRARPGRTETLTGQAVSGRRAAQPPWSQVDASAQPGLSRGQGRHGFPSLS